jgi:hypothetical protein
MPPGGAIEERFARIEAGFGLDGFAVAPVPEPGAPGRRLRFLTRNGWIGVAAEHRRARNSSTGAPKKAFYVEGDPSAMGWLIGAMAEPDVSRMAGEFVENVTFAFFGGERGGGLRDLIVRIVAEASERMLPDIPPEYLLEIDGILDGCRAANPGTTVRHERLLALNLGIDCLLAHVYTGRLFAAAGHHPGRLRVPIGCNAFSLSGPAAVGRHFFGRDFMFPTADVFQDTACMIVYHPLDRGEDAAASRRAFVSQTAPGIVGTMTGMNASGVAIGVDMLPSSLCDPERPGFNSLLLIRDCMHRCSSAEEAVERIVAAQRGVSWLYPVADAGGGAFVIEAGRKLADGEPFPLFDHVPRHYRRRLPGPGELERMRRRHGTPAPRCGLVARGRGCRLPMEDLVGWNRKLWAAFDTSLAARIADLVADVVGGIADLLAGRVTGHWKHWKEEIAAMVRGTVFSADAFGERGFINAAWTGRNCPGPFYFAPQREQRPNMIVATNHAISPEMRLTSMNEWIGLLGGGIQNDIQWRYDELNREILEALDASPGGIEAATAWELIDFLRPNGRFPEYYNPGGKRDWRQVQVHGSVTLCELTGRTMTSRFGRYGDEPVTLRLGHYLGEQPG